MQFPIVCGLHRSRLLDAGVAIVALLATAAIIAFPGASWLRLLLGVAAWGLAALAWRGLTPAITAIRLERHGEVFVEVPGQAGFCHAPPEPGGIVHPWLTAVRLKTEAGGHIALIVTVDSLAGQDDFRRLRMFLRWQAGLKVPDVAA